MATANLSAASLSDNGGWTKVGSLTDVQTINSDDTTTSYYKVLNTSGAQYDLFWTVSMPPAVSISDLTQSGTFGRSGANTGNFRFRHKVSSTSYNSEGTTNRAFTASWNTVTSASCSYGPGGAWTETNVNATAFGVTNWNDGSTAGREGYQTYGIVTVTYVPKGMFVFTYGWLLPLIGTLYLPSMVQGVVRAALNTSNRIVTYTLEELEQVKEEIRQSQTGYCFMGA